MILKFFSYTMRYFRANIFNRSWYKPQRMTKVFFETCKFKMHKRSLYLTVGCIFSENLAAKLENRFFKLPRSAVTAIQIDLVLHAPVKVGNTLAFLLILAGHYGRVILNVHHARV